MKNKLLSVTAIIISSMLLGVTLTACTEKESGTESKVPEDGNTAKILFVGNSYTYYNAMPSIFENIVTSAGGKVAVEYLTVGSHSLIQWADPTDEVAAGGSSMHPNTQNGGILLEEKLASSNDYDIVVLQEKSTRPVKTSEYADFVSGAKALAVRIGATQTDCKIYMYETWGSPRYAGNYGGTISAMEAGLRSAYESVAAEIGASVSYVGKAFTYVYENYTEINLYHTDDTHPSYAGSYLAACVHAATLLDIDPRTSTYSGSLDAATATVLKQIAYDTVFGS